MRLLPAQYVKPYLKRQKNDAADAEAICEAVTRPTMWFVPIEHRSHKGLNNRAENSHLPLRKREKTMQGFRSPGSLQRFVSIFSALRNLFVPPRSKRSALAIYIHRLQSMAEWNAAPPG